MNGMPHDLEAEWCIIALTFADPGRIKDLVALPEDAFYFPMYRDIFRALKKIYFYGRKLSLPLVRDILMEWGKYDEEVATTLLNMVKRYTFADVPAYWDGYWDAILDAYHKRLAVSLAREIEKLAQVKLLDSFRLIERVREKVTSWEEKVSRHSMEILAGDRLVELLKKEDEGIMSLPGVISEVLGGLGEGELIVVAGRPGTGKTALLLSDAWEIAAEMPVLFVSREMTPRELLRRLQRMESNLEEELLRRKLFITDHAKTPEEIFTAVRATGAKVVVVDYLQRLESGRSFAVREQEVGYISHRLKDLALDEGIVLIVAAQLNRESERRENKEPYLSDLRDSGRIEQDANAVILLWRSPFDGDEEPFTIHWKLAKNRRGKRDRGELAFLPSKMEFYVVG